MGLPLKQIRELLDRDGQDLPAALNERRSEEKRRLLRSCRRGDPRRQEWTPELQAQATKGWSELIADVESALGDDPASDRVQALAARLKKPVEGFTGGDGEISAGLRNLYADQANWPGDFQKQLKPFMKKEVWD